MADPNILRGAKIKAAAELLGLSEDETFGLVQRGRAKQRRATGNMPSEEEALAQIMRRAEGVAAVNADMPANIDDKLTIPTSQVEFGESGNQDDFQNFGGVDDKGRVASADIARAEQDKLARGRDDNNFVIRDRQGNVVDEIYVPAGQPTPPKLRDQAMMRDFGVFQKDVNAPQSVLGDALASIEGSDDPRAIQVSSNLEDAIRGGDQGAERSLAREAQRRDRRKASPEEADAMAERILRREFAGNDTPGSPIRAMPIDAREAAKAQLIAELSGGVNLDVESANRVNASQMYEVQDAIDSASALRDIGVIDEKDYSVSRPISTLEVEPRALEINLASTYANPTDFGPTQGPMTQGQSWVASNTPGYRESGAFNDYPQVAVGQTLDDAGAALGRIQLGPNKRSIDPGLTQVRGIDDLERAVAAVVGLGAEEGVRFTSFQDGKNVTVDSPGINEVLQRAGYNEGSQRNLAAALYQLEAGKTSGFNSASDELYGYGIPRSTDVVSVSGGGDTPALGGGQAEIARAGRQKVEGREVASELRKLSGTAGNPGESLNVREVAQARMPYVGAVAGEEPKRAQFLKGRAVGMTPEQRVQEFGEEKGGIANEVERRAQEAAQPKTPELSTGERRIRRQDASEGAAAEIRRRSDSDREMARLRGGQTPNSVMPTRQAATSAVVNSPVDTAPLQQRGGWMGGDNNGRVEQAFAGKLLPSGGPRRIDDSIRNELAALNSGPSQGPRSAPQQGPAMSPTPVDRTPDQRVSNMDKLQGKARRAIRDFRGAPRRQQAAAAVGTGLLAAVGLDGLIGDERDRREQEGYQ